jgi:hypothetical protein
MQCSGSVTFVYGSLDPHRLLTDPTPALHPALFVSDIHVTDSQIRIRIQEAQKPIDRTDPDQDSNGARSQISRLYSQSLN